MSADPSPFPPKPGPPPDDAPKASPGFFGPVPRLEGPVMGAVRFGWNLLLSAVIGIAVGGFGTQFARPFIETLAGPLGSGGNLALSIAGWIAGLGTGFVLFMAYYLDDREG